MAEKYREAQFYKKNENSEVQCLLCPHLCTIKNNEFGFCKTRKNIDGTLYIPFYGMVSSVAIDPIEKKPLYHFYPGSTILSIGTVGCSFTCLFCQNYSISQYTDVHVEYITPQEIYELALSKKINSLAFTYSEPLIWFEFVKDTAEYIKKKDKNFKIVLVTNGYINFEPLKKLIPLIDAMNIDLKSFKNDFYKKICSGSLDQVLHTISYAQKRCHIEVTTLIIETLNDNPEDIESIAKFLAHLDKNIPLHISKYYPAFKLSIKGTSDKTIESLAEIAKKYLDFVYYGNMFHADNNTICSFCGNTLIKRYNFTSEITGIKNHMCTQCKNVIPFIKLDIQ